MKQSGRRTQRCRAFSLIELLVVLSIIAVILAMMLPAVQAAREAARRAQCQSRQKQLGVALHSFEGAQGAFPPGRMGCDDSGDVFKITACPPGLPAQRKTAASGWVLILPQLEEQTLYDELSVNHGGLWNRNVDDLGWYYSSPEKYQGINRRVEVLVCPSDSSAAISNAYSPVHAATGSYAFVQGTLGPKAKPTDIKYRNNGAFLYVTSRRSEHFSDGMSHTFFFGEVVAANTWESSNVWTYALANADCLRTTANPLNTRPGLGDLAERQNGALGSEHPGGAFFCYADGHVAWVADDIDNRLYQGLSTIAGGEILAD